MNLFRGFRKQERKIKMERLFEATIRNADTNEILTRVSSYSQEGLEEEMGKTKWIKFASRDYEEDKPEEELPSDTFTGDPHQPSGEDLKAANEELVFDDRQDKKLEEDLGYEDEPSGHIEDLETHKEELRREREENL